jgi:heme exporter protein D
MLDFIKEAGYGIFPVMAFGIAALVVAILQVRAPRAGRATTASWLMGLTGMAGILGTATGVQMSARYIHEVTNDKKWIFLLGLDESLNNLVGAAVLITLTLLVMLVAHVRHQGQADAAPQRSKERVPDAGALQRVGA